MRRGGERFGQALFRPVREEDLGPVGLLLIHDTRVFELLDQRLLTLVVGVTHLKNFLARIHIPEKCDRSGREGVKAIGNEPLDAQSRFGKVQQVLHRNEINEGVSNITTFVADC